jgi:hypothetical protein
MKGIIINIFTLVITLTMLSQLVVPVCFHVDDAPSQEIPLEEGDDDNKKEDGKDKIFLAQKINHTQRADHIFHLSPKQFHFSDISMDVIPPPPKARFLPAFF